MGEGELCAKLQDYYPERRGSFKDVKVLGEKEGANSPAPRKGETLRRNKEKDTIWIKIHHLFPSLGKLEYLGKGGKKLTSSM